MRTTVLDVSLLPQSLITTHLKLTICLLRHFLLQHSPVNQDKVEGLSRSLGYSISDVLQGWSPGFGRVSHSRVGVSQSWVAVRRLFPGDTVDLAEHLNRGFIP